MRKFFSWTMSISMLLICASAITYTVHFLIFRDTHHIFIYMVGDIGFLFLDVLLVILLIERLLARREKRAIMEKLNMVIGVFFSEIGFELLRKFSNFVMNAKVLEKQLEIKPEWKKKDFQKAMAAAQDFSYEIKFDKDSLSELREFLVSKRSFLLRLLENPNLLEHERFTDLLRAVFHLAEELAFRGDKLDDLPESDYNHLIGDLKRAYSQITVEWIAYTTHLKESYPFLYSLAARVNPMNPHASPVVI
ncbi:MAG: hypothetical protein JSV96_06460 [Candidatus Aminicenantes bacterium]|nr:MAG: hypothetical protein JSV96_06460 [Candidatus Aminicenantes bacterium]